MGFLENRNNPPTCFGTVLNTTITSGVVSRAFFHQCWEMIGQRFAHAARRRSSTSWIRDSATSGLGKVVTTSRIGPVASTGSSRYGVTRRLLPRRGNFRRSRAWSVGWKSDRRPRREPEPGRCSASVGIPFRPARWRRSAGEPRDTDRLRTCGHDPSRGCPGWDR